MRGEMLPPYIPHTPYKTSGDGNPHRRAGGVPTLGLRHAPRPLRCFQHNVELGQVMPTRIHIGGLRRPSYGWGGTIAPVGIAPEGVPHCNCISMLSAGPRRRPESHEDTPAHASLGPPQWTWQSLAALRNKSSCLSLPVLRKFYFTEQQQSQSTSPVRR